MPKISELPLANKLKEEDYIPIVQDGVTKKVKGTHFVTEEEYSLDAFSPTITANDKAMYKFGEGDNVDFSDSAYDGAYKSAILTGCTKFVSEKGGIFETFVDSLLNELVIGKTINGTNGIVVDNANEVLTVKFMPVPPTPFRLLGSKDWRKIALYDKEFNYIKTISFRTSDKIDITSSDIENAVYCRLGYAGTEIDSTFRITDTNNANIPYPNLVMSSVKMPVLKTTGKNLFNTNKQITSNATYEVIGDELILSCSSAGWYNLKLEFFNLTPNKPYTLSYDYEILEGSPNNQIIVVDSSNTTISNSIAPSDGKISMIFYCGNSTKFGKIRYYNIQSEETSAPTSYEPYKSNILSCLEPVTLGKVGDVQDTLNMLTGEVVERTKEIV